MATQAQKKATSKMNARFGAHLKLVRESKGLSLRDLADLCNLDNSNISKLEHGKSDVQLSTISLLAKGLGVHPRELVDFDFD